MIPQTLVFLLFSAITLGAGLAVVTSKNILHSAFYLILSFVGVAGLYVLLEAPFLAVVQILVYVGAIAVLIVFAIMLTRRLMSKDLIQQNAQWIWAGLGTLGLFAALAFILFQVEWPTAAASAPENQVNLLGEALVGPYLVPFEVASILLLIALVGSIIIAREEE